MGTLVRLEGVKAKETPVRFIERSSQIMGHLKKGTAITIAGSNGALNIYKDDDGYMRGQSFKWCVTTDKQIFHTELQAKKWFDKWKKKIQ